MDSYRYTIPLIDKKGCKHNVTSYGIERITNDISRIDFGKVVHLFRGLTGEELGRPIGSVIYLLVWNMQHGTHDKSREMATY